MLIRSQNRKVLINTEDIYVKNNLVISMDKNVELGSYCSEERSLEVLNQIEAFALNGSKYDIIAADGKRYYKENTFHMPEK